MSERIPDEVLEGWAGKSTPNGPGILSACAAELLAERAWRREAEDVILGFLSADPVPLDEMIAHAERARALLGGSDA